jgi:hypothetical protein
MDRNCLQRKQSTASGGLAKSKGWSRMSKSKSMLQQKTDWIKAASEPQRTYRTMVVGWGTVVLSLNLMVVSFNKEFLFCKDKYGTGSVQELALKRFVISAIAEVKLQIDKWYGLLRGANLTSRESNELRVKANDVLRPVDRLFEIRNLTFHFGDQLESPDDLLAKYALIEKISVDEINAYLKTLIDLGISLQFDAVTAAGD